MEFWYHLSRSEGLDLSHPHNDYNCKTSDFEGLGSKVYLKKLSDFIISWWAPAVDLQG